MIREQTARTVILRPGAFLKGNIIGIQTRFQGADHTPKGVFIVQTD